MLEQITGKRRLLAFPARLYNSVVRWCTGLKSDTGTVIVSQKGESASIDVDIGEVSRRAASNLANMFPMIGDTSLLGAGLKWSDGRICIDESYISGVVQRMKGK